MDRQALLFQNTYASLRDRIAPSGYAPTSVTGAYPGMFPRDASIQVMAHVSCGDLEPALRILRFLFRYHKTYGYTYALHMILEDQPPFSAKIQADTTFFLLCAWCRYLRAAPDTAETVAFRAETLPQVREMADYFFQNGYYSPEKHLLRNPSLEGPRMHSYFNCYDLLTNVYASQAFHELARVLEGPEAAVMERRAADLCRGVHGQLTASVDGRPVYMEMHALERQDGRTLQFSPHVQRYLGFGWVNLSPLGAHWFGADPALLENTYQAYRTYATVRYFGRWDMLEGESLYRDGRCQVTPRRVLGKALAWELIYCKDTGRTGRVRELLDFISANSGDMYRENWRYEGGGGDTANQEHASWMVLAMRHLEA